jgi:HPt (histidine-containing phosphotransfer) domain-containing protein
MQFNKKLNIMTIDKDEIRENLRYYDKPVVVQIIDIFMEEYPGRFEELQKNIKELNFEGINWNAHSLKGILANFTPEIAELARKLMELGDKKSADGIQQLFEELISGTKQLVSVLGEMRHEYES